MFFFLSKIFTSFLGFFMFSGIHFKPGQRMERRAEERIRQVHQHHHYYMVAQRQPQRELQQQSQQE
ncbi:hypothetical protein ILUMI_20035 [Ignelater luminosus]|uniref:Uncharacterized protein n=1 Tax=Ignelater luminosus TaxID=2038154 RepID=A0A8K0G2M6_IGNLU|nr:hypothetical protein ILUMI_20035 [Ignelater luminosus]